MKQVFILLLLSLATAYCIGQNQYFVPFNTDYDTLYERFMNARQVKLEKDNYQRELVLNQFNSEISYRFHEDSIYRIEVQNIYHKKKDGQKAYEGCRSYFQKIGAKEAAFFVKGTAQHIVAIKAGTSYELIFTEHDKKQVTISLIAKCVRFTPIDELSQYDFLADM